MFCAEKEVSLSPRRLQERAPLRRRPRRQRLAASSPPTSGSLAPHGPAQCDDAALIQAWRYVQT